jgi:hypothetical protein
MIALRAGPVRQALIVVVKFDNGTRNTLDLVTGQFRKHGQ